MYHQPGWDDAITIETWPRGLDRLFAMRDFKISNEKGDIIGDATTSWLIVDINTHRPARITDEIIKIVTRDDTIFPPRSEKIEFTEKLSEVYRRKVGFADLDIVGHVNNVSYMAWCMDAIPLETHLNNKIAEIEINFLSEAKYGEEIQLNLFESDKKFSLNVVNTKTSRESARARIIFR